MKRITLLAIALLFVGTIAMAQQKPETTEMTMARLQAEKWAAMAREASTNKTLFEARAAEFIKKYNELKAAQEAPARGAQAEEAPAEEVQE